MWGLFSSLSLDEGLGKSLRLSRHSQVTKSPDIFNHKDILLVNNRTSQIVTVKTLLDSKLKLSSPPVLARLSLGDLWWVSFFPVLSLTYSSISYPLTGLSLAFMSLEIRWGKSGERGGERRSQGQERCSLTGIDAIRPWCPLGRAKSHSLFCFLSDAFTVTQRHSLCSLWLRPPGCEWSPLQPLNTWRPFLLCFQAVLSGGNQDAPRLTLPPSFPNTAISGSWNTLLHPAPHCLWQCSLLPIQSPSFAIDPFCRVSLMDFFFQACVWQLIFLNKITIQHSAKNNYYYYLMIIIPYISTASYSKKNHFEDGLFFYMKYFT